MDQLKLSYTAMQTLTTTLESGLEVLLKWNVCIAYDPAILTPINKQ